MRQTCLFRRRRLLGLTAAAALVPLAAPRLARAQAAGAWPSRGSVRLLAQFPPGGLVDTVGRLMAPALSQALGQTVVVENRAGAGGVIGTDHVAKQPADGYTLLISHASVHVFSAATMPNLPFHPVDDFTHIGLLVEAANVLLVRADSPFRTLDDYIAAARRRPVRYGSSGIGSAPHLLGAMMSHEARVPDLEHVPYRGSAPAMQDLMAGQIESMFDPITTNVQMMKEGTLRCLGVSAPARLPAFPDVPTFAEQGFPQLTSAQWLGLSGPRNLPAPVVERLTGLIPALTARPELRQRLEELQTLPRDTPVLGADFTALMREQIASWTAVARQFNIVVT
ncbi:tripartite tricarboxylate transporter substrate binding protein [Pseudoroseomonas cervicalis]|uniref:Bug family tripartite tricarboxylate transporter substrate binding protein n=1 Tax=Teichococcus cervicalis TaxID=204525 RepID=UPI0022F1821F|nr:tripartite tricarboxylate transporter substrate binding protein [Pseudoroseomonas cervicalis]WBV44887.1 tripartite tricarboxylate transporter substrate binding protein [Pseudoroseomonas cervicalis]